MKNLPQRRSSFAEVLNSVGRFPDEASFRWSGRISILAYLTFHTFFVARLLSPLQWLKYFVRERPWRALTHYAGSNERKDFHAQKTELYFLGIFVVALALWFLGGHVVPETVGTDPDFLQIVRSLFFDGARLSGAARVVVAVLILECTVWVFYYLVVRSFVERDYALYDKAEYLLQFPVVVAVQCVLFSLIAGVSPLNTLLLALGAANESSTGVAITLVRMLGIIYMAIAIAILVNNHPELPIRRRSTPQRVLSRRGREIAVIGAGDVVTQRLVGGLIKAGIQPSNLHVLDLTTDAPAWRTKTIAALRHAGVRDAEEIHFVPKPSANEIVAELLSRDRAAIIACSSVAHAGYLRALGAHSQAIPFAVEKPIVVQPEEVAQLIANQVRWMKHGFAFSYYIMEKALPLMYLLEPRAHLLRFLAIESLDPALDADAWASEARSRSLLGKLQKVYVCLHEEKELRDWAYDLSLGGLYHETMLHPLMIWLKSAGWNDDGGARAGAPGKMIQRREWISGLGGTDTPPRLKAGSIIGPSYAWWELERDGVQAVLSCGKNFQAGQHRRCVMWFEHGCIEADFDRMTARVSIDGRAALSIRVRPELSDVKYGVLAEMFLEFVESGGEWQSSGRQDELEMQIVGLEFLNARRADWIAADAGNFRFGKMPPEMAECVTRARELTSVSCVPKAG